MDLNEGILCIALSEGSDVCVEGPLPTCSRLYTSQRGDTCARIVKEKNIPMDQFLRYNPGFNCSLPIEPAELFCLDVTRTKDNSQLASMSIAKLGLQDPEILKLYSRYKIDPSERNYFLLGGRLLDLIGGSAQEMKAKLLDLEANDPYFSQLKVSFAKKKLAYCQKLITLPKLQECWCDVKSPALLCAALTKTELASQLGSIDQEEFKRDLEGSIQKSMGGFLGNEETRHDWIRKKVEQGAVKRVVLKEYADEHANATAAVLYRRSEPIFDLPDWPIDTKKVCEYPGGLQDLMRGMTAFKKGGVAGVREWMVNQKGKVPEDTCLSLKCCLDIPSVSIKGVADTQVCGMGSCCINDLVGKSLKISKDNGLKQVNYSMLICLDSKCRKCCRQVLYEK
jgi:hypothetical protein